MGVTRSAQSKICWFSHILQLIGIKFLDITKQFKLKLLIESFLIKGNNCCFSDWFKHFNIYPFGRLLTSLVEIWYDDRCHWILHFESSLSDLDLDSRSQWCKKANTSKQFLSKSHGWIWMKYGNITMLLRPVGLNLILFHLVWSVFKGVKPT